MFASELVLDDGDIGVPGALSFVQYHAPDFFSDITELSQAFDRFSDAAFLLDTSIEVSQIWKLISFLCGVGLYEPHHCFYRHYKVHLIQMGTPLHFVVDP